MQIMCACPDGERKHADAAWQAAALHPEDRCAAWRKLAVPKSLVAVMSISTGSVSDPPESMGAGSDHEMAPVVALIVRSGGTSPVKLHSTGRAPDSSVGDSLTRHAHGLVDTCNDIRIQKLDGKSHTGNIAGQSVNS